MVLYQNVDTAEAIGMRLGQDLGFFNLQAESDPLRFVWEMVFGEESFGRLYQYFSFINKE